MTDAHSRIIGWLFFSGFVLSGFYFNKLTQQIGPFKALIPIYSLSALIFLNIGLKALKDWNQLKNLSYSKCTARIYDNAYPKFLFLANIAPLHAGKHVIGAFLFCYVLTPFYFYWKIEFPDSAPRAPLALTAPLFIHMQISTAFDLIILLAIKRNKKCHSST